jgi:hypothetical protein
MMVPKRGNVHRLKPTDAEDLLSIGKRFQNDFGGEARTTVETEAAVIWEEPRGGKDGDALREVMVSRGTWILSGSSTGGEVRTGERIS